MRFLQPVISRFEARMILALVILLFFIAYSLLIIYFRKAWKEAPHYSQQELPATTKVSVIIAARNEEKNIGRLLTSLKEQDFPSSLLEIIVVDDHSTDRTVEIVKQFPGVTLISLRDDDINSYKKKAIETGVAAATGELIITTDADCTAESNWIKMIVSLYQQSGAVFIAAPVAFAPYQQGSRLLYSFQVLDFLVLQGITGASIYRRKLSMCNGANLAYSKQAFVSVDGFKGIDHIASGDDMLLMHKINKAFPGKIQYLKSPQAIVYTNAETTWSSFFNQRIRWASKADKYEDKNIFYILLLVYLFNLSFLLLLIAGFWNYYYWFLLIGLWITKTLVEFSFVSSVAAFFKSQSLMKYFFFLQPIHISYTIIAGWLGKFGKYEWKGRKVN